MSAPANREKTGRRLGIDRTVGRLCQTPGKMDRRFAETPYNACAIDLILRRFELAKSFFGAGNVRLVRNAEFKKFLLSA